MSAHTWLLTCAAASPVAAGDLAWTVLAIALLIGLGTYLVQAWWTVVVGGERP